MCRDGYLGRVRFPQLPPHADDTHPGRLPVNFSLIEGAALNPDNRGNVIQMARGIAFGIGAQFADNGRVGGSESP
jgi:hypothetical protein